MIDWDEQGNELVDLDDEEDDIVDTSSYMAPYQNYDVSVLEALTDAEVKISSLIANEFIIEAYKAATMLRNLCGDSDAHIADLTNTIRDNLAVLANEITKDPVEFVISVTQSIQDPQKKYDFIAQALDKLIDYETEVRAQTREGMIGVKAD